MGARGFQEEDSQPRKTSSCVWVGEGSGEKQIKGQKGGEIEVSGTVQKGVSSGGGIGQSGLAREEMVLSPVLPGR